jgi:hypothetical protein
MPCLYVITITITITVCFSGENFRAAKGYGEDRAGHLTFTMGRLLYQLGWWISGAALRVSIYHTF